jgi:hypothetical protein
MAADRRSRAASLSALAAAALLAGCGAAAPKPDPAREVRVVGEVNALCRQLSAPARGANRSPQLTRRTQSIRARIADDLTEIGKTAVYLPAGRDLAEAHAARHKLEVEESKRAQTGFKRGMPDVRFDRLQLRIYRDELALGITCSGQLGRVAGETAHILAASAR